MYLIIYKNGDVFKTKNEEFELADLIGQDTNIWRVIFIGAFENPLTVGKDNKPERIKYFEFD